MRENVWHDELAKIDWGSLNKGLSKLAESFQGVATAFATALAPAAQQFAALGRDLQRQRFLTAGRLAQDRARARRAR